MTRLEKELDDIVSTLLFPARYAKTFVGSGASYPPYNIIKLDETRSVVEIAVAGFKERELTVLVEDGSLKISGKKITEHDGAVYIHKGIGTRAFERSFALSSETKVERAEYADGILSVFVSYVLPEEKKPNEIPINRGQRQYLTE